MKRTRLILLFTLLLTVIEESRGQRQTYDNDVIKVDLTKSYSTKKELILQDFMDVEYVALETTDDFINQGVVQAVGIQYILVKNRNNDGDIFIYDRTGKAIRKINRKGQGGEEYLSNLYMTFDEDKGEIFVSDIFSKKVCVYDLNGNFLRSFSHKKDKDVIGYYNIFNYDRDNLIYYDLFDKVLSFGLVSKQGGSVTKEIKIPFKEKKLLMQTSGENMVGPGGGWRHVIIPYNGNWILTEHSSDTMYTFLSDHSLRPFLVRTPSIQNMDPEIYLEFRLFSDRYIFMETIENVYDWSKRTGFPKTYFMYDRQEKTFGGYTVYNGDYTSKKEIYMNHFNPLNHETEAWYLLETHQLVESYKKGELKGKLKEIAATLEEDDNPVIMLVRHKK